MNILDYTRDIRSTFEIKIREKIHDCHYNHLSVEVICEVLDDSIIDVIKRVFVQE